MTLLTEDQFAALYGKLDKLISRSGCTHTLRHTRAYLNKLYIDYAYVPRTEIIRANIAKIIDLGGLCDCEVLMNITPSDWQARRDDVLMTPDIIGEAASGELISQMMLQSIQHTFEF